MPVEDPDRGLGSDLPPPPLPFVRKFCYKKVKITHFEGGNPYLKLPLKYFLIRPCL